MRMHRSRFARDRVMAADHYLELFGGKDTAEARAAALRLSAAIEWYIARCEAEAKR